MVALLRKHPLPGNLRDLFRVAYRVLAARSDVADPMPPADAVEYGLDALNSRGTAQRAPGSPSRTVAAAFAENTPLDHLLSSDSPLSTSHLFADLKAFVAREIRRVASERGSKPSEFCDVSERSLRDWAADAGRKISSEPRQNTSEIPHPED